MSALVANLPEGRRVGLELRVELLAFTVMLIKFDDLLVDKIKGGPPPFQFDVGGKQELSLFVDGPLDNANDTPTGDCLLYAFVGLVCVFFGNAHNCYSLTGTGDTHYSLAEDEISPVIEVLLAGVPLDDIVHPLIR
jgi:hypothetical protein